MSRPTRPYFTQAYVASLLPLDENESDAIVTLVDPTGPTAKHCSVDDLEAREVFDLVFSVNDELNWEVVAVTDDTEG